MARMMADKDVLLTNDGGGHVRVPGCGPHLRGSTSERVPSQDGEVTCLMPQTHFMAEPRQDSRFLNHVPIHSTAQGALWDFRGHLNNLSWGHLGRQ